MAAPRWRWFRRKPRISVIDASPLCPETPCSIGTAWAATEDGTPELWVTYDTGTHGCAAHVAWDLERSVAPVTADCLAATAPLHPRAPFAGGDFLPPGAGMAFLQGGIPGLTDGVYALGDDGYLIPIALLLQGAGYPDAPDGLLWSHNGAAFLVVDPARRSRASGRDPPARLLGRRRSARGCSQPDLGGDETMTTLGKGSGLEATSAAHASSRIYRSWVLLPLALSISLVALCLGLLQSCTPPALPSSSYRVTLVADGREQTIETAGGTVSSLLSEAGILIGPLDRVTPPETTALSDLLTVTVVRVEQNSLVITQTLPFGRQVVRDASVPAGETRLLQTGQSGILERHYRITLEDRREAERVLVRDVVVQPPRDEVRLVGARPQLENVPITGTLAFLSNQDAWVMRESSFQRRGLTVLGDLDGRVFTLSPDGRYLLFTRGVTESDHLNSLWLVATTEAAPNPIPLNVSDLLWAGWAPKGRSIAWTTAEVTEQAPGWRGTNDLWTADVTDPEHAGVAAQGARSGSAAVAMDGGARVTRGRLKVTRSPSVALTAWASSRSRDGEMTQLLEFPAFRTFSSWSWNPALAWSPDGELLTTVVHDGGTGDKPEESPLFHLVTLSPAGDLTATLSLEVGMWAAPTYSPDGERLLYGRAIIPYQSATSLYTLYRMDRDGSDQHPLYAPASGEGLEIPEWVWSPDGATIAFVQSGDIFVLNVASGAAESLTDEGTVTALRWR